MKVLLLNPPDPAAFNPDMSSGYPLGLLYLAAALEHEGAQVEVLDLVDVLSWRRIERELGERRPDVVGIRSLSTTRAATGRLIRLVRDRLPDAPVVLGGQHAAALAEPLLRGYDIDGVFLGEAEESIVQYARVLGERARYRSIAGFAFREGDRVIVNDQDERANAELDRIAMPAFHLVDFGRYRRQQYPLHVVTSRGCPYRCRFCAVPTFDHRYRRHGVARVIEEIRQLHEHAPGPRMRLYLHDDFFQLQGEWTEQLCRQIMALDFDVSWIVRSRGERASLTTLKRMRAAGCTQISIGLESGSPRILRAMDKRTDLGAVIDVAGKIRGAGIGLALYLILGYPGETLGSVVETLRLARELQPTQVSIGYPRLLPGTALCEQAKRQGAIDDDFWLRDEATTCPVYSTLGPVERAALYYPLKLLTERDRTRLIGRALRYWSRSAEVHLRRLWAHQLDHWLA